MGRLLTEIISYNAGDLFDVVCDYKSVGGEFINDGHISKYKTEKVKLEAKTDISEDEVYMRCDTIENISGDTVNITLLASRFVLPDGDYEVYTQYSNWHNESMGCWQPLVTGVFAKVESVRTTVGAAPVLAIWNRQQNRGIVFHLLPMYSWSMSARRFDIGGGKSRVEVTMGPSAKRFELKLEPGECLEYARIIYYEFRNKTDLDCWKLHRYLNKIAPRRSMPVIYNTWFSAFDWFTFESLEKQVELAAKIGAEYFVIDAGWFGEAGNWWQSVGDWEEYQHGALKGRMKDISDKARALGMKFGLWFEIDRAAPAAKSPGLHPDYYISYGGQYFVNYANPEARKYILDLLTDRIKRYNIGFIKFDFNADMFNDPQGQAFIRYYQGYVEFLKELKRRHPDLYCENCASGGMRMQLANGFYFDSFWLSDNQCAIEGVRIFKDTMLRMPPQWIEKWAVIETITDFEPVYSGGKTEKIVTTHDAGWDMLGSVRSSWLRGFMSGSPLGISCNFTKLSENTLEMLASHIEKFKKDRELYISAEGRILADTETLTSLEFCSVDKSKIKIFTFVKRSTHYFAVIYPVVDPAKTYVVNGEKISGEDIERYGIKVDTGQTGKCEETEIYEA